MSDINVKDYNWGISPTGTVVASRDDGVLVLRTKGLRHFYLEVVKHDFSESEEYDLNDWQVQEIMDQIAEKVSEHYAVEIMTMV